MKDALLDECARLIMLEVCTFLGSGLIDCKSPEVCVLQVDPWSTRQAMPEIEAAGLCCVSVRLERLSLCASGSVLHARVVAQCSLLRADSQ